MICSVGGCDEPVQVRGMCRRHYDQARWKHTQKRAASNPLRVSWDELEVTCWCEATTVGVPIVDVNAGRTKSCGAVGCQP